MLQRQIVQVERERSDAGDVKAVAAGGPQPERVVHAEFARAHHAVEQSSVDVRVDEALVDAGVMEVEQPLELALEHGGSVGLLPATLQSSMRRPWRRARPRRSWSMFCTDSRTMSR